MLYVVKFKLEFVSNLSDNLSLGISDTLHREELYRRIFHKYNEAASLQI